MNNRFKTNQAPQRAKLVRLFAPSLMALAISGAYANANAQIQTQTQTQTQDQSLPTVTVTAPAARADTLPTIAQARAQIATVAGGANIVDAEQYKEGRVSTLSDALQFSPGIFVASRFGAEESRMSIRGSGLQRTYHMRGIEVLQDGVPLNLADGSVDFQAIEPLSARYIEVYRGANALQFGSATLGGAVNFVSPSGLTAAPATARVELGSFGYKRAQVSTAGKTETLDWFIAGSEFYQDGYRDHARQDTQRFSGNLGIRLSEAVETRFFLNAVNTNSELPGTLTKAEMNANPQQRQTDAFTISGDQQRDFKLIRLSNLTTIRLDPDQHVEVGAFYSYKSLFHPIYQLLEQDSNDYGLNLRYIGNQVLWNHKNQLIVGATLAAGTLADNRFFNVFGQAGARTTQAQQQSNNYTVFAENQYYFLPSTALVLGAQAVSSKRELDDQFRNNGVDSSVNQTYRHVSPKIGLLYQFTPDIQMYGNLSGSYEPPTFGELTGGLNVAPVSAQRASTIEIGTRGFTKRPWGGLRWDVSIYHADLKNELLVLNDPSVNTLTINADRTIHQGIEAGLEANFSSAWTLRASYLLNDFRFNGDRVYSNNQLAGVPRQILNAEVLYKTSNGLYLGPNVQVASAAYVDHANTLQAAGYGGFGFKLRQQVNKHVSWFVDARNLTNKTYAATTNVIANAKGIDSAQFFPSDGRSVYLGIELKY